VRTQFLQDQGASRYERTLETQARRGKIIDRNGVVVASSVETRDVWAYAQDFVSEVDIKKDARVKALAKLLGLGDRELLAKLDDTDRKFVLLKRQVEMDVASQISALGIKAVTQEASFKRSYPIGESLAHVVGFSDAEQNGQEGIELALDKTLAGKPGRRKVIRDKLGRVIEEAELLRVPVDGSDISLSIDSKLQSAVFYALKGAVEQNKARAGAAIVVDTHTGEVLALANWPSYDPNNRVGLKGEQLRNRVITDLFEPGSTMKPVTISLALDSGVVKPTTTFQTSPGRLMVGNRQISDTKDYGLLTVAEVIQHSSNIGTTKIGLQLPPRQMWEFFTSVGFGQRPNLSLGAEVVQVSFPGAASGRVRPFAKWQQIEQATMSYGYGISVSLAQLARTYTMFARDGDIIPLTLAKSEQAANGVQIIKPETARIMRGMLENAAGPNGTAPKAQIVGYRIGGKTGTARKQGHGGYLEGKYIGSFVGFAPASDPRIVVAVLIDEPSAGKIYGGEVAAPAFAQVAGTALRLMNIAPDAPFRTSVVVPEKSVAEALSMETPE
jgi:cell division protein FtsI (penicillin-binding protein 3)